MTSIEAAGQALTAEAPVFQHPDAAAEFGPDALTGNETELLTRRARAQSPVFVALLPQSAGDGGTSGLASTVHELVGEPGTYLVLLPDLTGSAGSTFFGGAAAVRLAQRARAASADPYGLINAFITDVNVYAASSAGGSSEFDDARVSDQRDPAEPGGGSLLPWIGALALAGGGFLWFSRRRQRVARAEANERQLAELRVVVDEDITAFGEQLDALDVAAVQRLPEAQEEYQRALDCYDTAKRRMSAATDPQEVSGVTEALDEGRWLLACATARAAGEPVPERRPACFFDPRHGLSDRDVPWAPPGGVERAVPACRACATRIEDGEEPPVREVGADRRPYWEAGPAYSPWAGGYFGGMLPGFLIGTMAAGTWYPSGYGDMGGGDSGDLLGGGGFDGGGFGGGDFSGGGFGGGDFGGGDFGGGGF